MSNQTLHSAFALDDRIFVVTGASSGIGRAMAGFLSDAGAQVILLARRRHRLKELAEQIVARGGQAFPVEGDLNVQENIEASARKCLDIKGKVDGVINAAGINLRQAAADITPESWNRTLDLNLKAPFFFTREFVDTMKSNGYGRIINIASLQSSRAFADGLAYGASKGGICQLTRAMAEAWSKDGITCNAIAPGFFPSELTEPVFSNPKTARWAAAQTAIGRNGEMDDLLGATLFFASPASAYVTGQTLHVDGGFTAR